MLQMIVRAVELSGCHHPDAVQAMVVCLLEMVTAVDYDWTGVAHENDWKNLKENALRFTRCLQREKFNSVPFNLYGGTRLMREELDLLARAVLDPSSWA